MKRRTRGLLTALGAAVGITACVSVLAAADTAPPTPPTAADAATAPLALEDFAYPGANGIINVKLLRGDGHVTLADCSGPSQIQIWTRAPGNADNKVCFAADTTTGFLALELADVFAVQTSGRSLRASLTAGGTTQTLDVPKDGFKGVGEGVSSAPTTVVELRVTG
ncbi:hypothetical protein ABT263_34910 [Kitasatospora sp. NPDC001603]|uniref:hypothetical protein n=1 Tax=Kitasatospora sp. NPDC001603 TaxID=3154388 RepID=UPI00333166A0